MNLLLIKSIINLILSFWFGSIYGLEGILFATAFARLVTNCWYDPYLVYTIALQLNPTIYLKKYLYYILVISVALVVLFGINQLLPKTTLLVFVLKIVLCVVIPNIVIYIFCKNTPEYKSLSVLIVAMYHKIVGKLLNKNLKS